MLKSYEAKLTSDLQNEDALNSILYDFESELNVADIATRVTDNGLSLEDARKEVVKRLVNARKGVFAEGKKQYEIKQNKPAELTGAARLRLKTVKEKTALIDNVENLTLIEGIGTTRSATSVLDDQKQRVYKVYDELGERIERDFSKQQVADYLNLRAQGFNWESN